MPDIGQTNFTAGEISPKLYARTDFGKYRNAARLLENFAVLKQGGAIRRSGTRYVKPAADQAAAPRMVPFSFSTVQACMLDLGAGTVGFVRTRAPITVAATDAAVDNGSFDTDATAWTVSGASWDEALGAAKITGASGYVRQQVTVADPTREVVLRWDVLAGSAGKSHSVRLDVGTAAGGSDLVSNVGAAVGYHCHAFTPGAGNSSFWIQFQQTRGTPAVDNVRFLNDEPLSLGTPYAGQDLSEIDFAQSADILYLASRSHPPFKLQRTGHRNWSLEQVDFVDDPFDAVDKYPGTVTFHEDRLSWGGTNEKPQTFWLSRSGDFEVMTTGPDADHAIEVTISADQVNAIRWMVSGESLFAGTVGGEWRVFATDLGEALTPDNVNARRSTTRGSAFYPALQVDEVILYTQRSRRKLREFAYVFEADGYKSPDLTLLADHLFAGGINHLAFQQEPNSIVWTYRDDGLLLGLTYDREQSVVAWHRHVIAGTFEGGPAVVEGLAVIPNPESSGDDLWLCVKRSINGATVRSIEYLEEYFQATNDTALEKAFFVDAGVSFDAWNTDATKTLRVVASSYGDGAVGSLSAAGHAAFTVDDVGRHFRLRARIYDPESNEWVTTTGQVRVTSFTSGESVAVEMVGAIPAPLRETDLSLWARLARTFTGAHHLEGETCSVVADGATMSDVTVTAGGFSIDLDAAVVHVGLHRPAQLQSLDLTLDQPPMSTRSRQRSIERVAIDFLDTAGVRYGRSLESLDRIPFRRAGQTMDMPVPLYSGTRDVAIRGRHGLSPSLFIVQDQPMPVQVRALIPKLEVFE